MYEVEVKAHLRDRAEVIKRLQTLVCEFGEELHQVDRIFIPEGTPFPNTLGVPIVRVRKENDRYLFTLKISQTGHQDALERELEVGNGPMMIEIFQLMKWQEVPTVNKRRIKAKHGNIEIVLDKVEDLGEFIEAEKIVEIEDGEERKKIQQELCDFLESLGIPKADLLPNYKYDIMLFEKFGMK